MRSVAIARSMPSMAKVLYNHFLGKQVPIALSVDVTAKCNLRCKHCYVYRREETPYEMNQVPEESHEHRFQVVKRYLEMNPTILHCTFIGGEPLMPKVSEPLTRRLVSLFPFSWIVTNGTFPIPNDFEGKNNSVRFIFSIDGVGEHHNKIRGNGVFERAMQNLKAAQVPVYAHNTINTTNAETVELLAEYLHNETPLKGIMFSFHTPEENNMNDPLLLSPEKRDNVLDRLIALKDEYGDFIWASYSVLESFRSKNQRVFDECLLAKGAVHSLDYKGERKEKCVMGPIADCSRCGCVIPALVHDFFKDGHYLSVFHHL